MGRSQIICLPWVVSPELALAVPKAEGSTSGHVPNLDALRRVQVVPGVLRVLLNALQWSRLGKNCQCTLYVTFHYFLLS